MFKKYNEIDFYSNEVLKTYNLNEKMRYQLSILDSLDAFTRKHSENVGNLTCRLCDKLGLDEGFIIYCTMCGFIHDIGKIFVPPEILQKASKLTEDEYTIMKNHTLIGYKMCMNDPELRPYKAGPIYHHEALDGTGYPKGLLADEISYEGQIIRVADEFDAITSKRQYKTHIGIVDTLKILIENSKATEFSRKPKGYLFKPGKNDKKIVKALIKLIIEDTEIEIFNKTEYLEYLYRENKRYSDAYKYYNKMLNAKTADEKTYFNQYASGFLIEIEKVEEIPIYVKDIENAINQRKDEIDNLKKELKKIKGLRV